MDHQTIQAIATEVARHISSYAWVALIIQIVFVVAAAGIGALVGEYLKTRGKLLATRADFAELQKQLEANTKLVATVRSEVAQRDWARREWATLRRLKIEALVDKMNECRTYLERHTAAAYHGEALPAGDPITALNTISQLYFPQLKEAKVFSKMHRDLVFEGEKLRFKVANASDEADASRHRSEYAGLASRTQVFEVEKISVALTDAARKLLEDIMGAQHGSDAVANAEEEDQQKNPNELSEPRPSHVLG